MENGTTIIGVGSKVQFAHKDGEHIVKGVVSSYDPQRGYIVVNSACFLDASGEVVKELDGERHFFEQFPGSVELRT